MTDSKLIDSSVWLAYLFNGQFAEFLDSGEILLLSSLSLFEIKKKLMKGNLGNVKIDNSIDFVKKRSLIVPLDAEIAEKAVELSIESDMPAIDSLIYATSLVKNAVLVTLDNDFRGLQKVLLMHRKSD